MLPVIANPLAIVKSKFVNGDLNIQVTIFYVWGFKKGSLRITRIYTRLVIKKRLRLTTE